MSSILFQESMKNYGCTTPFGIRLDNICTDPNVSRKALNFYNDVIMHGTPVEGCLYPCTFLKTKFLSKTESGSTSSSKMKATILLDKFIKVTSSSISYTELELIAECGGYVGLFLGISVYNLSSLFEKFLKTVFRT